MHTYHYHNADSTLIARDDGAFIPVDEDNTDYRILVESGAPIGPYVPPPMPVPSSVTRAQALMALYNANLLPQVQAVVNGHEYLPVKIWFDNALYFERNHAYLQAIGQDLNLTDERIDDLFIAAALLTA